MTARILEGHVLDRLAELPKRSVQLVITSPPYHGLRSYSTAPQVWGGEDECGHEWGDVAREVIGGKRGDTSVRWQHTGAGESGHGRLADYATCLHCPAWRGELGSEPTVELFVANLVSVFRAVRRVLRDDGVVICNLGDSYSGSGKGPTGVSGIGDQAKRQGFTGGHERPGAYGRGGKEQSSCRGDGSSSSDLCDGCQAISESRRTSHNGAQPVLVSDAYAGVPNRARSRLHGLYPGSSDLESQTQIEQSDHATLDLSHVIGPVVGQSLDAQVSTNPEFAGRLPGAYLRSALNASDHASTPRSLPALLDPSHAEIGASKIPHYTADSVLLGAQPARSNQRTTRSCSCSGCPNCIQVHNDYTTPLAKNLLGVPWRFALAMQADGWVWRSWLPWVKRSAMPESCTDRPTNALEVILMFSKRRSYFWDGAAVRQAQTSDNTHFRSGTYTGGNKDNSNGKPSAEWEGSPNPLGRAYRNSDPFFAMLDQDIAELQQRLTALRLLRASGGLHTDEDGLPISLDVNPQATSLAHYASFPEKLVEPFVKAGTSERGQCAECGKAWVRMVECGALAGRTRKDGHGYVLPKNLTAPLETKRNGPTFVPNHRRSIDTLGWAPGCACNGHFETRTIDTGIRGPLRQEQVRVYVPHIPLEDHPTQPQTVLDPFVGTGTVLLVSERLVRDSVGVELSAEYAEMARTRLAADAPLVDAILEISLEQLSWVEAE